MPPPRKFRISGVLADRVFALLAHAAAWLTLATLAGILVSLVIGAWPAIEAYGLGFLTNSVWDPVKNEYGGLVMIYGTLATSAIPNAENNFGGANYSQFSDPTMDRLIGEVQRELDPAKRKPLWAQMQKIYTEELPVLPLFFRTDVYVVPKWLTGVVRPDRKMLTYKIDFTKALTTRRLTMGVADGIVEADGEVIYQVKDMKVALSAS